jgi:hypothetical protein
MPRELYTENKEIRLTKMPANRGTNTILFNGDRTNKFNGEVVNLIDVDDGTTLDTAIITKTKMKIFSKIKVGEIAAYWDSEITTLVQLKNAMKAKYGSGFSVNGYVTLVTFEIQ